MPTCSITSRPALCYPQTVAHQVPLFMGFFRQEYWSGFPFSFSRGSCQPRYWTLVFGSSCMASSFFTTEPPGKPLISYMVVVVGGNLVAKSCLTLVTPWTVACQDPLSMAFPRQEYWIELPFPSPGNLPNPGIKTLFPAWEADSLPLRHLWSLG